MSNELKDVIKNLKTAMQQSNPQWVTLHRVDAQLLLNYIVKVDNENQALVKQLKAHLIVNPELKHLEQANNEQPSGQGPKTNPHH